MADYVQPASDIQGEALDEIIDERLRQDSTFGVQNHHPAYWLAILGKQVGQLGSAVLGREWFEDKGAATAIMRREAVQTAAVAVALIECIDRGDMPDTLDTSKPKDPRQLSRALDQGHESINYID